jgi:hypothetical protein
VVVSSTGETFEIRLRKEVLLDSWVVIPFKDSVTVSRVASGTKVVSSNPALLFKKTCFHYPDRFFYLLVRFSKPVYSGLKFKSL